MKKLTIPDIFKGTLFKGGSVVTIGNMVEYFSRFARNIILTRLLIPEQFGLMATTLAVVGIFEIFGEIGIRQAVVHSKRGTEPELINAAWWISTLRGVVLFLMTYMLAPSIADFYHMPELEALIKAVSVAILLRGMLSPGLHALQKELKFVRWVIVMHGAAFLSVILAIVLAFVLRNVWALVIGYVAEALLLCILSFALCPFVPSLRINRKDAKELIQFAKGMFGIPILTFIFLKGDIFVIGKMLSMEQLGMYSLAKNLAELPAMFIGKIITTVVLPLFAEMQDDKEKLRAEVLKITRLVAFWSLPGFIFLTVFGKPFLHLVYGQEYASVAIPFGVICIYSFIRALSTVLMQVFLSVGRPQLQRTASLVRAVVMIALIYPLIKMLGLTGSSIVLFIAVMVSFVIQLLYVRKTLDLNMPGYFKTWTQGIIISVILLILSLVYRFVLGGSVAYDLIAGLSLLTITMLFGIFKYDALKLKP